MFYFVVVFGFFGVFLLLLLLLPKSNQKAMESAQNCIEDCEKDIALKDLERKKNKTKTKTFHVCVPWSSNCEVN